MAQATYRFNGVVPTGNYKVTAAYCDEDDGVSNYRLTGSQSGTVATWKGDQRTGSDYCDTTSLIKRVIAPSATIKDNELLTLRCEQDPGEPCRVDAFTFELLGEEGTSSPAPTPTTPEPAPTPTPIPEADNSFEGFGKDTIGGRDGKIVRVTNLKDSGVGSLRWALEDVKEPRTIVFDVQGRIKLKKQIRLRSPYVTLSGQTAPGKGVVVSGARINVETYQVIIQGMKMRVGDDPDGDVPRERDNISLGGGGSNVRNVVLDRNSFTWSVDESLAIWGSVRDVTISNNIIAESLDDSIHIDEGATRPAPHSMGFLIGHNDRVDNSRNVTIIKNLFVSNKYRNPHIKQADNVEFHNNYIYNYGAAHQGMLLGGGRSPLSIAIIGNVYERGVDTNRYESRPPLDFRGLRDNSRVYLKDNYTEGHTTTQAYGRTHMITNNEFFNRSNATILRTDRVKEYVLNNVGPRVNGNLDPVDSRIIKGVRDGTAKIIDSPSEVGGFGVYNF